MDEQRFPTENIDTARLRLRPFREDDAADLAKVCADPVTQRYISRLASPYTVDDAMQYITEDAVRAWTDGRAQWALTERDGDRLLGSLGVPYMSDRLGTAEIGYMLGPWARGKGYLVEILPAVADFLFRHDVARVELLIRPDNVASQVTALRAGFVREAALRAGIGTPAGDRIDKVVFARLPGDPPGQVPRRLPDLPGGRLTDGRVVLAPLTAFDVDDHLAHQLQPDVVASSVPPMPPDRGAVARLCEYGAANAWLEGQQARLAIRDAVTDDYAGAITLRYLRPDLGEAVIGYGLIPDARGKGFATAAVRLLAGWAFAETDIVRLTAGTSPENAASQAVLRRVGFVREGVQRARVPGPDGQRLDDVIWGLLPGELT